MNDSRTSGRKEFEKLSEITDTTLEWAREFLEDPDVTAADNFLELGGHSMIAIELSARAEARFGAPYDMQVLFQKTLGDAAADLAARL